MLAAILAAGMLTARGRATGRLALIPQAGAVIVVVGVVLLAWFVFSGDPYVNGAASRWSRRTSHCCLRGLDRVDDLAPLLWRQGTRGSESSAAFLLALGSAAVMLQAVAAV